MMDISRILLHKTLASKGETETSMTSIKSVKKVPVEEDGDSNNNRKDVTLSPTNNNVSKLSRKDQSKFCLIL